MDQSIAQNKTDSRSPRLEITLDAFRKHLLNSISDLTSLKYIGVESSMMWATLVGPKYPHPDPELRDRFSVLSNIVSAYLVHTYLTRPDVETKGDSRSVVLLEDLDLHMICSFSAAERAYKGTSMKWKFAKFE